MPNDDFQKRLFDLANGTVKDMQDMQAGDDVFATSDAMPANVVYAERGRNSAIVISFDKFSDGRGFSYARRIRDSGFTGRLIASGHIIADQADYLRRCGFSHAEILESKTADWQAALIAIPSHFQHMAVSPRSRMASSVFVQAPDDS